MPEATLYLIRHGQTEWNLAHRLQGGQDSPLTAAGVAQAHAVAAALADDPPGQILASPLGRAQATAQILADAWRLPAFATDPRLAELRFGQAEGLTRAEIETRWPDLYARRAADLWTFRWPGGESYADLDRRLAACLQEQIRPTLATSPAPLAIVAHETANTTLLGQLLGLPSSEIVRLGQPNDVVCRLREGVAEHRRLESTAAGWQAGLLKRGRPIAVRAATI